MKLITTYFIAACLIFGAGLSQPLSAVAQSTVPDSPTSQTDSARSAKDSSATTRHANARVYKVNYWISGAIIVAGLGSGLLTPALHKDTISNAELANAQANPDNVPAFDRISLHQDISLVPTYDNYSTYLQEATILAPLTLLIDEDVRKQWIDVLMVGLEVNAVVLAIYTYSPIGPLFQDRYRPLVYYSPAVAKQYGIYQEDGNNKNSFYSGHVASASAGMFFVAKVLDDFHPELGNNRYWLYAGAAVPSLAMCYFRLKTLDHFPTDILTGLTIGTACGILIPELHRIGDKDMSLGVYSSPYGTGLKLRWTMASANEIPSAIPQN